MFSLNFSAVGQKTVSSPYAWERSTIVPPGGAAEGGDALDCGVGAGLPQPAAIPVARRRTKSLGVKPGMAQTLSCAP